MPESGSADLTAPLIFSGFEGEVFGDPHDREQLWSKSFFSLAVKFLGIVVLPIKEVPSIQKITGLLRFRPNLKS